MGGRRPSIRVVPWEQYARRSPFTYVAPPPAASSEPERLLREREVLALVGASRQTLWRMERAGDFPKRIRVGKSGVRWRLSDVRAWQAARTPKSES